MMLAALIERHNPADEPPIAGAAAFQLAEGLGRAIDQLHDRGGRARAPRRS